MKENLNGSRSSETNPAFLPLPSIHYFPLIPSNLFCQIWDIWSISHLSSLWPLMSHLYSWKWCFPTQNLSCLLVHLQHTLAPALFLIFLPLHQVSVTSQKPQSSASKAACPSSIRFHALPRNHESHSHFHCAGAGHPEDLAAKTQGQGREVALA